MMIINGEASSCLHLANLLDIPVAEGGEEEEDNIVELYSDPTGMAGRRFGVSRGFAPDNDNIPPSLKLFCMGIGIGPPWKTLPAVLTGYFGNPNGKRDWIEASLKQGQLAGRWSPVLELDDNARHDILKNRFDDTPLIGSSWGRRPFELATLRLQNLLGIQIQHRNKLKHVDDRCLTQLGGCAVVDADGETIYSWIDQGLCDIHTLRLHRNAVFVIERTSLLDASIDMALQPSDLLLSTPLGRESVQAARPYAEALQTGIIHLMRYYSYVRIMWESSKWVNSTTYCNVLFYLGLQKL